MLFRSDWLSSSLTKGGGASGIPQPRHPAGRTQSTVAPSSHDPDGDGAKAGFSIAGWGGYHGRYNGAYVPTGESRDGRPIFKHTGPGMEWCRAYWAHGFWKIGHFHWPLHQPELCCAGGQSDAMHPKDMPQGTPWYEHKGTRAGHDFSSDPADFKPATG